jgi:hypothetical protein
VNCYSALVGLGSVEYLKGLALRHGHTAHTHTVVTRGPVKAKAAGQPGSSSASVGTSMAGAPTLPTALAARSVSKRALSLGFSKRDDRERPIAILAWAVMCPDVAAGCP